MIIERPALERRVTASLDASRIPVLLGGCGSGRSSLLLRLQQSLGAARSQYIDLGAAASTPERTLSAILAASPFADQHDRSAEAPATPRAAFEALIAFLDRPARDGHAVTFLIDEVLDMRTFENFPGLRDVQQEFMTSLAASGNRFVLASRFTTRAHRLLRDAPARFEVIHVPTLDVHEVTALALRAGGGRTEWARAVAPAVTTLAGGRASYTAMMLDALASSGSATDPVAALAALMSPSGRLAARCRESFEFRLHRARGYGALKAILGILADDEPLNLTEIALRLRRTPGSTKDYLSWLEDVDLVAAQRKKYAFEDPLLRLYVRLYGQPAPPSDELLVREVHAYAQGRFPRAVERPAPVAKSAAVAVAEPAPEVVPARSGIIEID